MIELLFHSLRCKTNVLQFTKGKNCFKVECKNSRLEGRNKLQQVTVLSLCSI